MQFAPTTPFLKTLRTRADATLAEHAVPRHGGARILGKSAVIFAALVASYVGLVFYAETLWQAALLAFMLSQAITMVGFCVMHDGGHRAYSNRAWLNKASVMALDLIGGSHALWVVKHGFFHHTYPNIDALDDDLEAGGLLRLHPDQPWRPHHRFQLFYAPVLYSLLAVHWILSDFPEFFRGRIGTRVTKKPSLRSAVVFSTFKAAFFGWAVVLPLTVHAWWVVLLGFLAVYLSVGFTMSLVFQLAHVSDAVEFPTGLEEGATLPDDWAAHQLRTTVDFAPGHPLVSFYMGGLNHQVVHHLLPRYSHVRYRLLQPVVAATAAEFGIEYRVRPTVRAAIADHARALWRFGRPAPEPEALPSTQAA